MHGCRGGWPLSVALPNGPDATLLLTFIQAALMLRHSGSGVPSNSLHPVDEAKDWKCVWRSVIHSCCRSRSASLVITSVG